LALQKQVHIYNVDTSAFYNDKELALHKRLNKMYLFRGNVNKESKKKTLTETESETYKKYIQNINRHIKKIKNELLSELNKNKTLRVLRQEHARDRNVISIFESTLTRTIGIKTDTLSDEIMVIRTYYFKVLEDLILNGYVFNGEKYVYFTSSAGQIRTKKSVFIKESTLHKYQMSLMCGLTIKDINKLGGVNINKYLAYLALCNSATDVWQDFDIDKAIVVNDMETLVNGVVDFINDKDYTITRKQMDVPTNHTDGCGMVLPSKCKKNMMVRLPWIKGLLSPFLFDKFIQENSGSSKIKDIYGKEWDIFQDGIEIIFTKSQFKMWKYYPDWDTYKKYYKQYNCQAGTCNEERDIFDNAKLGYQMLQTLTDITDDEIEYLCHRTKRNIINIGSDRKTMLKTLGVTKANIDKNYLQQAIEIYPELLNDTYCKEILKQVKKSLVNEARAGKFDINGKYTFIVPDLYAFCEYLFLGEENPKGLLQNKEVYCKLYRDVEKLDCLRSPHLYREHAIRKNVIDEENDKWFITNGVYTSCHDLISKMLQFDVDGDTSLVVADKKFVEIAERNMKDIVPLYYNMAKAGATQVNNNTIYNGLITAYTGGNIGMVSNNITKIWNSDNINLDAIRLLCMENNFTIDYAKTLYKPERPVDKNKIINQYTQAKVPHFFIYAKKKHKDQVESVNNSVTNRLEQIIPNPNINFQAVGLNNFNYRMLMNDKRVSIETDNAKEIIKKYTDLDIKKYFMPRENKDEDSSDTVYLYKNIRNQILQVNNNINYVVDVLTKYLYRYKHSRFKTTLWSSFGDIIIENLKFNIVMDQTYCERCGDLIEYTSNSKKYCDECAREVHKEIKRNTWHKYKDKYKILDKSNSIDKPINHAGLS
jgi:arsenate reductase-like glutaredoxin family protein